MLYKRPNGYSNISELISSTQLILNLEIVERHYTLSGEDFVVKTFRYTEGEKNHPSKGGEC